MEFRIQLLGGFGVWIGGEEVPVERFRLRRARSLIKLLALAPGHRVHRDQVLELLWPDSDLDRAANSFYQALHAARRILDPQGKDSQRFIALHDDFLFLNPANRLEVDVQTFEAAARRARESQDPGLYQEAVRLYSGDLLPEDLYEEWSGASRESLRQAYTTLLLQLAGMYETAGEYQPGIDALQRLVAADPSHEEAHMDLMRLYALAGQRHNAIRQFEVLKETLQRELDAEPDAQAAHLYQEILAGQFSPPVEPAAERASALLRAPAQTDRHNLPGRLSSFVGRDFEIEQVKALVLESRLVTLLGPGGVGKTRLSIQAAFHLLDRFADGTWFIELGGVTEPEHIVPLIASVFHLRESRDHSLLAVVRNYLQNKRALLILDNCEHLIDSCARLVEDLLASSPALHILATSRETLSSEGEITFTVPTLSIPAENQAGALEELEQYEAVRLFLERARQALPGLALSAGNAATIARISQRLDGLPLAIELAAARVGVLSVEGIAERLEDRFRLLAGGSRTALPRYQTIRASIDWSYELLSAEEQALLQQLSVFAGGWTLEAAETVCAGGDVLELLTQLVNKSLVGVIREPGQEPRYYLLETVSEYVCEKWAGSPDASAVKAETRDRHLRYFQRLAQDSEPMEQTGRRFERLARLSPELENVFAALRWAMEEPQFSRVEAGLELVGALRQVWYQVGYYSEARSWLEQGLDLLDTFPAQEDGRHDALRAKALWVCGIIVDEIGTLFESLQLLEKSLLLYRKIARPRELAGVLLALNQVVWRINRDRAAAFLDESLRISQARGYAWELASGLFLKAKDLAYYDQDNQDICTLSLESIRLFRETGDVWSAFAPLTNLGLFALFRGDYAGAHKHLEEAVHLGREMNDASNMFYSQANLGILAYFEGDFQAVESHFQVCLGRANYYNSWLGRAYTLRNIAAAANHQGDAQRAYELYSESLRMAQSVEDSYGSIAALVGMAGVAVCLGQSERAARLLGAVEARLEGFTKPLDPIEKAELAFYTDRVQEALDEPVFTRSWQAGRNLSLDEALAEAQLIAPPSLTKQL